MEFKLKNLNTILKVTFAFFLVTVIVLCTASHFEKEENAFSNSNVQNSYQETETYILNTNSKKIHKISCGTARLIKTENREEYKGDICDLFEIGYSKCGNCFVQ